LPNLPPPQRMLVSALNEGFVTPEERVVLLVTGNGLKDIKSAMRVAGEGYSVAPDIEDVETARVALGLPTFK
jgi:threonine synthase